jgi:TAT (twin-arginine translocation) pathway signal sequence
MSAIENVSRRWFLKGLAGAGALVLGARGQDPPCDELGL